MAGNRRGRRGSGQFRGLFSPITEFGVQVERLFGLDVTHRSPRSKRSLRRHRRRQDRTYARYETHTAAAMARRPRKRK